MNGQKDNRSIDRQYRSFGTAQFRAGEANGKRTIEAYFAVFGDTYEFWPGATESFDAHAFDGAINDDVRCLINHDPKMVLGRTKSGTFRLSIDNYGLKGVVDINDDDQDAVNAYARVLRGDVSQCSVGFDIIREDFASNPDGTQHWTIMEVKLYEGSIVTFPAYEQTEAHARDARQAEVNRRYKEYTEERISKWHSNN